MGSSIFLNNTLLGTCSPSAILTGAMARASLRCDSRSSGCVGFSCTPGTSGDGPWVPDVWFGGLMGVFWMGALAFYGVSSVYPGNAGDLGRLGAVPDFHDHDGEPVRCPDG